MTRQSDDDQHVPSILVPRHGAILIGRSGGLVDVAIDHPSVSLRHAKVFRRAATTLVRDLGSTSGTYVDGHRVHGEAQLVKGGTLALGQIHFLYDGIRLLQSVEPEAGAAVSCIGICRYVDLRHDPNARLTLLQDVSLAVQPGELACLIGPSGSGKSTLLSVLAGRQRPTTGTVLVRGRDLHADFEFVKHDLAFVPQAESLYLALTVRQALTFSAALRLPADTSRQQLDDLVTDLLVDVGLQGLSDVRVRDLSGGQRKRVSLANEIAHRPGIVLIDEVTSGLDEQGDLEIMSLIRSLTAKGIAVVCITHNTLNIERTAHRVVVLSSGGRLACCGTPDEVCRYFGIAKLGDVYEVLNSRNPADWQSRFRHSGLWRLHVGRLLPGRDGDEGFWGLRLPAADSLGETRAGAGPRRGSCLRQVALLVRRWSVIQRMDPRPTLMAILQAVFVAGLLIAFFGNLEDESDPVQRVVKCRHAAFLLMTSAFWLGCNNSAPEIARERRLYEQERSVGVRPFAYFCSKALALGAVAVGQSLVVFVLLASFSGLPGIDGASGIAQRSVVVAGAGLLGTLLGLAISAHSRTEQVAVRAVPIIMIPQIVLADVLSPLSGWLSWVAPVATSTFWTFRAFIGSTEAYQTPGATAPSLDWAAAAVLLHGTIAGAIAVLGLYRRMTA